MDSEAIKYRAVLEGLQFQQLDLLKDQSIDECVDLGVEARLAIQDIIDANNQLRKQLPLVEQQVWEKAAAMGLSLTPEKCKAKAMECQLKIIAQAKGKLQ